MIYEDTLWKVKSIPRIRRCISGRTSCPHNSFDFESHLNFMAKFNSKMHFQSVSENWDCCDATTSFLRPIKFLIFSRFQKCIFVKSPKIHFENKFIHRIEMWLKSEWITYVWGASIDVFPKSEKYFSNFQCFSTPIGGIRNKNKKVEMSN